MIVDFTPSTTVRTKDLYSMVRGFVVTIRSSTTTNRESNARILQLLIAHTLKHHNLWRGMYEYISTRTVGTYLQYHWKKNSSTMEYFGATHYGHHSSVLKLGASTADGDGNHHNLPECRPDDLLIRVAYAELNPVDLQKLRGGANKEGQRINPDNNKTNPLIVGYGGSGIVQAVGSNLLAVKDDDDGADNNSGAGGCCCGWVLNQTRVAFLCDPTRAGAYATHVVVDHRLVARVPSQVTLREAATVPLAGCTSYESLVKLGCLPQEPHHLLENRGSRTLLVVGGAGGLGSWAIQLARARYNQLTIVATASSEASSQWCRQRLGADRVISHDAIQSQLDKSSVDYILCLTEPTPAVWEALSEVVSPYGSICLTVAGKSIQSLDMGFMFFKAVTVTMETVFSSIRTNFQHIQPSTEMDYLLQQLATGVIKAPLSPQLPTLVGADDWKQCLSSHQENEKGILDQLASGHTIGKLVMKIGCEEE